MMLVLVLVVGSMVVAQEESTDEQCGFFCKLENWLSGNYST